MKKFKLFICLLISAILLSGCNIVKRDIMEDVRIVTTTYPLEYIIQRLYGKHSIVNSVYPDGIDISTYEFTEKQLSDYSEKELFVYTGASDDKDIALKLLERNKELLLIDASHGMTPNYTEELWLNPSNLLMLSQNVKNGLIAYINSNYLIKEIEENYDVLELELSELDAEIKLTVENASWKTIVTSSNSLKFLEKYGLEVIVLENESLDKTLNEVIEKANNKELKYIYILENETENDSVKYILNNTSLKELTFKKLDNITDDERDDKEDYFSIMNKNLEALKKELYK